MGVTSYESVVTSPVPPEKLFNAGVIDVGKSFVFSEESMGKGLKHRVDEVDKDNFSFAYTLTGCGKFGAELESITMRTKLEPSASGGSICKNTITFHAKAGAEITEEQFKEGEKEMLEMFKGLEGQLLASANA